jgi:MFS superfamily sulfate permease-like transporter
MPIPDLLQLHKSFALFRTHWKKDLGAGFLVFLLALPLSLGIAKASGFPAAMGVLSAMIGGLVTPFFRVSELSIKGPAAGLITLATGAMASFGGGDVGWAATAAVVVVMAVLQIAAGYLRLGSLSDFFPSSAVHGMLSAIGLIIISKQIPVLLGVEPSLYTGLDPITLFKKIPEFIEAADRTIATIGLLGLFVMVGMPGVKIPVLRDIPAPIIILALSVPAAMALDMHNSAPAWALVEIGDFWGDIRLRPDFSYMGTFVFWKYVFIFWMVASLESLLTVKAVDGMDPLKRESNYDAELRAQGAGNLVSGFLGGLPMISEVVRSTSNVQFGARTKAANFFHGLFLLLAMLFCVPLIEWIPNAALAAMLVFTGYRLAAPKSLLATYRIGVEQLAVFITTIILTLMVDLLAGIFSGMAVKLLFLYMYGAQPADLFRSRYVIGHKGQKMTVTVHGSAVFSNLIGFKNVLNQCNPAIPVVFDIREVQVIDHPFMAYLTHFQKEFQKKGGQLEIKGLERFKVLGEHPLATRVTEDLRPRFYQST